MPERENLPKQFNGMVMQLQCDNTGTVTNMKLKGNGYADAESDLILSFAKDVSPIPKAAQALMDACVAEVKQEYNMQ